MVSRLLLTLVSYLLRKFYNRYKEEKGAEKEEYTSAPERENHPPAER